MVTKVYKLPVETGTGRATHCASAPGLRLGGQAPRRVAEGPALLSSPSVGPSSSGIP